MLIFLHIFPGEYFPNGLESISYFRLKYTYIKTAHLIKIVLSLQLRNASQAGL